MIASLCCAFWLAAVEPADGRLLVCHFNGDLLGEAGEKPAAAEGVRFGPGRVGTRGLLVSKDTKLSYPTASNLDVHEGRYYFTMDFVEGVTAFLEKRAARFSGA